MYNRKYILGYVCLIMLFATTLISAQPPFQTVDIGLTVQYPKFVTISSEEDFEFHTHVFNSTNGLLVTNDTTDCYLHTYYNNGSHSSQTKMNFSDNLFDFEIILPALLLIDGQGAYIIQCNASTQGGFVSGAVDVTEGGIEITTSRSITQLVMVSILMLFVLMSLICLFKVEDYRMKFISYWVSHLLLVIIFFSCWQMGVEQLITGIALTGIFRILFWITIIAVAPMIFVSVAWIVYIHAFNEHFQKLIDKGEDPETAFAIANKKKGWLFGN